jgi:hypothetical protein
LISKDWTVAAAIEPVALKEYRRTFDVRGMGRRSRSNDSAVAPPAIALSFLMEGEGR